MARVALPERERRPEEELYVAVMPVWLVQERVSPMRNDAAEMATEPEAIWVSSGSERVRAEARVTGAEFSV